MTLRPILIFVATALALAHPMGNFSVNHYSRLNFRASGVELTYVLDLAEIPTLQLLGSSPANLDRKVHEEATKWVSNLVLLQAGKRISWRIESITCKATDGAGGMSVLRTVVSARAPLRTGTVSYQDQNYQGRSGWKEIVIDHTDGAVIHNASQGSKDVSAALTIYPADPSVTPPQDLSATVDYTAPTPATVTVAAPVPEPPAALPPAVPAPAPTSFTQQQPTAAGAVVRGDFLSRMLQQKVLGWRVMSLCVLAAFGLGTLHAMSPGHGKTIVAAYLVGSRGTLKHAGLLGFVVTFTHTFTVFLLGVGVLCFQQYVVPEKIVPVLGAISGLSIVLVGAMLLYKRSKGLMTNSPDIHARSHAIDGEITPGGLVALGVSGGLVPCPSALILMLSSIALGRPAFGLVLLFAFSAGLSLVLMAIGMVAVFARHLLPDGEKASRNKVFRLVPVFSAVVVICLGLIITAISTGWLQPIRFLA